MKIIINPNNKFIIALYIIVGIIIVWMGILLYRNKVKYDLYLLKLKEDQINGKIIRIKPNGKGSALIYYKNRDGIINELDLYIMFSIEKNKIGIDDSLSKASYSNEIWFYKRINGKFTVNYIHDIL